MTLLEQIGTAIADVPRQPLSVALTERMGIHLLDTVGAWIAGRATEEGSMLASLKYQSRSPIHLFSNHPLDRIALACATIRLTEIDDIHMPSCITPSSVIIPVALYFAAVRAHPPDPQLFRSALLAGYEVMTRFGAAIDGAHLVYKGVWPTYFTAPMASAAVAARMLKLNATQTANAIGIALTTTSGAAGGPSSPSFRWLLLGLAVRAGCSAAIAAAEGYSSDRTLLDADWLQRTHGIDCDTAPIVAGLSQPCALAELSLKPYCAAKQCIGAIEASRDLFRQGVSPDEISALHVRVPAPYATMIGHCHIRNGRIPRITSAAYNIALAAYEPDQLFSVSRPDCTANPPISAFMERIEVTADEELTMHYPEHWPARGEAVLRDGRTISSFLLAAPGDPSRAFDRTQALTKFHHYVDPQIGEKTASELSAICLAAPEHAVALGKVCSWIQEL